MDIIEHISAITKMASGIEDHVVYNQLGDLRIEAYELKVQLLELKEENAMLKQRLTEAGQKEIKKNCYYFNDDGPYCTRCYDDEGKRILMHPFDNNSGMVFNRCPKCENLTEDHEYPYEIQGQIKNTFFQ